MAIIQDGCCLHLVCAKNAHVGHAFYSRVSFFSAAYKLHFDAIQNGGYRDLEFRPDEIFCHVMQIRLLFCSLLQNLSKIITQSEKSRLKGNSTFKT